MAAQRRRTVSRGTRRKVVWTRTNNFSAAVAAGVDEDFNVDLLAAFRTQMGITAGPIGLTVVRVRLMWRLVDVATQSRMGLMGLRVYTQGPDASEDELEAVDGPFTDPHADWMAYGAHLLTADGEAQDNTDQREADVKSMRKMDELSQSLVLSFQTADELAGTFRFSASVLVALP